MLLQVLSAYVSHYGTDGTDGTDGITETAAFTA